MNKQTLPKYEQFNDEKMPATLTAEPAGKNVDSVNVAGAQAVEASHVQVIDVNVPVDHGMPVEVRVKD